MLHPPPLFELRALVPADLAEELGAWLVGEGAGAVEEESLPHGARLSVWGAERAALGRLAVGLRKVLRASGGSGQIRVAAALKRVSRWEVEWTRHLRPVRISRTLVLQPTTAKQVMHAPGQIVLLEPALAFGLGEHATTRLAARELERDCRGGVGSVLDVGTGSGVLSIVAAMAGAREVVGLDVDPVSVAVAQRNAARNGVQSRCRFSLSPLSRLRKRFDRVVANIDVRTLLRLAPALVARLAPAGALLLTGLLSEDAPEVVAAYAAEGARCSSRRSEEGWALLRLTRAPAGRG